MHQRSEAQVLLQMLVIAFLLKSRNSYLKQVATKDTLLANALMLAVLPAAALAGAAKVEVATVEVDTAVAVVTVNATVVVDVVILHGKPSRLTESLRSF